MTSSTPPVVSGGLPVLGHALEMIRDRDTLFKRGFAEHGDLFTMHLGPQPAVVVTGAAHNRLFYTETDKSLNMQKSYDFLKAALGEVLFTASKETYYNQRPLLQEAFKREKMMRYIQAMNVEIQQWLDGLGDAGETNITEDMLQLTQAVAARAFIGPDHANELNSDFWKQYEAIGAAMDPILPPNLPLPKFRRRDVARKNLSAMLKQVIQRRRDEPERYNDLITTLLQTPFKDGSFVSDDEIVDLFIGLIFAGHETTAGQAAWLVALLLRHPDYLAHVYAEIDTHVALGQPIDAMVLRQLEHIYWAIDETTRVRPSADLQLRVVEAPIVVGDYEIPEGWRLVVTSATSHFLPDVFENPQDFDPFRYAPDRNEGKNPFSIVGFGGGIHKCTGMNFAKNEMAIITALFFQQFEVELLSEKIDVISGNGANRPSDVIVRYRRKTLADAVAEAPQTGTTDGCPYH